MNNSEAASQHHLSKRITLYIVLAGIFLTSAITAEIIGVKLFSLEALFGLEPINAGFIKGFNLPAGFLLWPIVFITTDIINEYYGKDGVRKISWVTAAMIAFVFLFLWITTALPYPGFWENSNNYLTYERKLILAEDVNDDVVKKINPNWRIDQGNILDDNNDTVALVLNQGLLKKLGDYKTDDNGHLLDGKGFVTATVYPDKRFYVGSYSRWTDKIFLQGIGIIIGSLIAFLIGQLLDASLFQWFKKKTGDKMIWLRATGSTFISQCFDSYIVLFIAFYLIPEIAGNRAYTMSQILGFSTVGYIYKVGIAIVLTPLIYLAHYIIDRFLGDKLAHQMMKEADEME